jgi:hypothetical protein
MPAYRRGAAHLVLPASLSPASAGQPGLGRVQYGRVDVVFARCRTRNAERETQPNHHRVL